MTEEELEQMITELVDEDVSELIERRKSMIDLYCDYCKELSKYDTEEYPEGKDRDTFLLYKSTEGVVIHEINDEGKHIGFLITMVKPNEEDMLYICEAYVKPERRHEGLMTDVVRRVLKRDYRIIRFMVFNGNPALRMWDRLLQEAGYKCEARREESECLQEYFYVKAV